MATAARVQKEDQRADVQRVEDQAHQQVQGGRCVIAEPVIDPQTGQTFQQDQRQAEPDDGQEVAGVEKPGVAQDGKNVHCSPQSGSVSGAPL